MTATSAALAQGRRELQQRCAALRAVAVRIGDDPEPWSQASAAIDEVEVRVVVVGEVNRGKSTFLNALMGAKVFPPRATVCTAVLTELRDGSASAELVHRDGRVESLGLDEGRIATALRGVVSKMNPDAEKLARVRLAFPNRFARDGVVLIDTPGVNDPEVWREEITRKAVQEADAAIFLLDPQSPLRQTERIFLQEAVHHRVEDRVMFVVTKIDQVSAEDLDAAMQRLNKALGEIIPHPKIMGVASKPALLARERNDDVAFDESGFGVCEHVLDRFLCEERVALELTARRSAIRGLGLRLKEQLGVQAAALDADVRELAARVARAKQDFRSDESRLRAEQRRRHADTARLVSDVKARAYDIWSNHSSTGLLSARSVTATSAAFRTGHGAGRGELRERVGRVRRGAERELYSSFERLARRVSEATSTELAHLDAAMNDVARTVQGDHNAAFSFAESALKTGQDAFDQFGRAQRLDEALVSGAVGLVATVLGFLSAIAGVAVAAVSASPVNPEVAVRGLLREASDRGRRQFVTDMERLASSYVERENRATDDRIRRSIAGVQRTLDDLERSAASNRAEIEQRRRELLSMLRSVKQELERLG